ncbi:N-acetylmuramoyl-L-alanine amidase family protein [Chryseobacterium potabilaquae]|uniref:N-acetylmuramoyl-L-alanine amidase n=1 Tax=Chryseobacterium potabilaquae TaxID=2675057 RepID=A0A6N4X476_9FLAO|nr:N-acetylmuramoyl-L-alanine amidase [Chryseobacterium potabilaquae]CAA7194030.1 Sporulation-specific N-acetylmuramoyl-L-alanine amidase [Chryseobacterium potabilaquae]
MKEIKLLALAFFSVAFLSFTPTKKEYIIIDAGHGGNDLGASFNGISEKEIVLNIAKQIKEINKSQEKYEILLTRNDDEYTTLVNRTDKINELNPAMVISLHINRTTEKETTKQGQEIFVQDNEKSKKIAEQIIKKFGTCPITTGNLHILKESKSPTVLVELGYINNQKDRDYLTNKDGQKEIAQKFVDLFNEN